MGLTSVVCVYILIMITVHFCIKVIISGDLFSLSLPLSPSPSLFPSLSPSLSHSSFLPLYLYKDFSLSLSLSLSLSFPPSLSLSLPSPLSLSFLVLLLSFTIWLFFSLSLPLSVSFGIYFHFVFNHYQFLLILSTHTCTQLYIYTNIHLYVMQSSLYIMGTLKVALLYRGVLYVEVILYSKECNWYTRCCLLNGGVCYRECPLREAILYICNVAFIMRTFCNVPIGTSLYKSTSEMRTPLY